MAQTLETLNHRMSTLQSIRSIVRTMKTLSAVNAAPYDRAAASIKAYHETVLQGLQVFAMSARLPDISVDVDRHAPKIALVFGSDHGLCGGYNETVAAAAKAHVGANSWHILAVGAQMEDALCGLGLDVSNRFTPPASPDGIGRLAGEILVALDEYRAQIQMSEIALTLIYMQRSGHILQAPKAQELLPLSSTFLTDLAKRPWESRSLPILMMDDAAIFTALIRNHLFASLFRAAAEAIATENAARLSLMQQAERAIDDRHEEMLQAVRSARQSEITNELLDVITGFEALKKKNSKDKDSGGKLPPFS
ncbi:FoF1 ATP synthase subunit gamma [Sneathiella sp. HT1-7]|jgi:F-type H+-transporting ATPase subunit gamma|uniref:F0F1 ATP synthase subunit gamma n=1 Tax=Sneathiella sp. HT1-7 TaxID=2887192 RepID=UPI001D155130|nr:FoF1 ATP synthase subunit gamma [Sneathiella sp. HT1-7]MCC3305122.1 F0F1 ATP synthase subunit gamma [Sneathiella sp. HT1-7]